MNMSHEDRPVAIADAHALRIGNPTRHSGVSSTLAA
jgi:hypothetical protein